MENMIRGALMRGKVVRVAPIDNSTSVPKVCLACWRNNKGTSITEWSEQRGNTSTEISGKGTRARSPSATVKS